MILRELREGQRFEFADKKTPLSLVNQSQGYTPKGTFRFLRNTQYACPVLIHEETNVQITAVTNTYQRGVIMIL